MKLFITEILKSYLWNYSHACIQLKAQSYMSLLLFYQQKTIKNYQNFLAKDLKDQCIAIRIKQKRKRKILQISTDIFQNQILLVLTDCLFWFTQTMAIILKDLSFEGVIY